MFVILFYVFRPVFVRPKPISGMIALNWIIQLSFVGALVYYSGPGAFFYLILSTFLAGTIHPCAGHFLAEHFVFVEG
jgi:sphingolipid delta-4 desaturase